MNLRRPGIRRRSPTDDPLSEINSYQMRIYTTRRVSRMRSSVEVFPAPGACYADAEIVGLRCQDQFVFCLSYVRVAHMRHTDYGGSVPFEASAPGASSGG
jgi:hypothetical protein